VSRRTAALLAALGLLAAACGTVPAAAGSEPARTAVPTWTLPFSLETHTPAPPTPLPVSASATPPEPAAAAPRLEPTTAPTEPPPMPSPTPAEPPRLLIPELKLDRDVTRVGIADGTWDLTGLDDQVGWLSTTGRHPGDNLAVVLVGHVTTGPGQYGPFAGLGTLAYNTELVYRYGGQDYVYAVRGQRRVDLSDVQQLYVPDGRQLLLVTCSDWNYLAALYTQRLIVTAEWIGTVASQ